MKVKLEDKDILEIIKKDKEQALSYYNQHLKPRFKKYYELYNGEKIDTKKYRMPETAESFLSADSTNIRRQKTGTIYLKWKHPLQADDQPRKSCIKSQPSQTHTAWPASCGLLFSPV